MGLGRRTRGGIEKWNQTESPEIPDKRETAEIPQNHQEINKHTQYAYLANISAIRQHAAHISLTNLLAN